MCRAPKKNPLHAPCDPKLDFRADLDKTIVDFTTAPHTDLGMFHKASSIKVLVQETGWNRELRHNKDEANTEPRAELNPVLNPVFSCQGPALLAQ